MLLIRLLVHNEKEIWQCYKSEKREMLKCVRNVSVINVKAPSDSEFRWSVTSLCVLVSDDEEISLVIEAACPERENAANHNHVLEAPDDDTLSVGPDMPDLPLDAPPDPQTSPPQPPTPEGAQPAEKEEAEETPEAEEGTVEEESTVREEPPSAEPQVGREEVASAEQQEENCGVTGEEGEREERQLVDEVEEEQVAESATQAEQEVTGEEQEVREETQPEPDSDNPAAVTANSEAAADEAPAEENTTAQEAPIQPAEGATQGVTEGGERSCVPCACQSLFSNYNSQGPSRRKNRPCSLPVSELETVIASACGEPETPRSHYIRIHHLLHSLPSAQQRAPSQEEEEPGEGDTTSTSPTLKTSKDGEGHEDEEDEDTTLSPSQVQLADTATVGNNKYITEEQVEVKATSFRNCYSVWKFLSATPLW